MKYNNIKEGPIQNNKKHFLRSARMIIIRLCLNSALTDQLGHMVTTNQSTMLEHRTGSRERNDRRIYKYTKQKKGLRQLLSFWLQPF